MLSVLMKQIVDYFLNSQLPTHSILHAYHTINIAKSTHWVDSLGHIQIVRSKTGQAHATATKQNEEYGQSVVARKKIKDINILTP